MNYIIDAYNLIGKLTNISLADKDKEKKLIQLLNNFNKKKKDYFILIFDGKNKETPYQSQQDLDQIKIVFTDILESADEYILRLIQSLPHKENYTVISSDNEIKYKSKKNKLTCINSESFFRYISSQKQNSETKKPLVEKLELDYWLNEFNKKNCK